MPIAIKCSGCGKSYSLKEDLAGKRVKCKCGRPMQVPGLPAKTDDVDGSDPMASLLDDALPATQTTLSASSARPAPVQNSASATVKKKKKGGEPSLMTNVLIGLGMVGGVSLLAAIVAFMVMRSLRPGFPTPEETFAVHQESLFKSRWKSLIRTYTPESQTRVVGGMLEFATSSETLESSPFVIGVLKKHGADGILQKKDESGGESVEPSAADAEGEGAEGEEQPEEEEAEVVVWDWQALAREKTERCNKAASAIEDKVAFYVDFVAAIDAEREKQMPHNPVLKVLARKTEGEPRRAVASGALGSLKIEGDTASGEMAFLPPEEIEKIVAPVAFKKIDGRWLIHIPSDEDFVNSPMRSVITARAKLAFVILK